MAASSITGDSVSKFANQSHNFEIPRDGLILRRLRGGGIFNASFGLQKIRPHQIRGAVRACIAVEERSSQNGACVMAEPSLNNKISGVNQEAGIFTETFTIRCYEVGTNRRASIDTIANLLQEVACNQVRSLGFSTDGFATTFLMRKYGLIWVTTRMHIEIIEYPLWGDLIEVDTWFQENRNGTRRDWLIRDVKTQKVIGRATSTWVMMNQQTRRLARITDEIREDYNNFAMQPPRWAFPIDHEIYNKKSLPKLDAPPHVRDGLKPRRCDLDMNQHVNNVTYIGWMLESLPPETLDMYELESITLEFRRECKHDDTVQSMCLTEEGGEDGPNSGVCGPRFCSNFSSALEGEPTLVGTARRQEVQNFALPTGNMMHQLGALFMELGRTMLTLHMGHTPADSVVNPGPAVFIGPNGPNPVMVQPFPSQTISPFGALPMRMPSSQTSNVSGGVAGPRNLNIHIHASDLLSANQLGGTGNSTGISQVPNENLETNASQQQANGSSPSNTNGVSREHAMSSQISGQLAQENGIPVMGRVTTALSISPMNGSSANPRFPQQSAPLQIFQQI